MVGISGLTRVAHPLCTDRVLVFGENRVVVGRTDAPLLSQGRWSPHTLPSTPLGRLTLILSIRGTRFHLTASRINSFPSDFCFICCPINLISGQAGNEILPFLSLWGIFFFFWYFPKEHYFYSHVDSFHEKPKQCAHMWEAHSKNTDLWGGRGGRMAYYSLVTPSTGQSHPHLGASPVHPCH